MPNTTMNACDLAPSPCDERPCFEGDLFRAIFEQAAVGVAQIETATGRFVHVNQRYCDLVGLPKEDLTATTFMAITHPDDLQADLDSMERLKAGQIRAFSMEKRYCRKDGTVVWVNLTVSPMWKIGESPTFHIAVVQDITERKQSERALAELNATLEQQVVQRTRELEESRQQLQAIVEGTSDAVFLKDVQGRYVLINQAGCDFAGKRLEDIIGRDDSSIFSPADAWAVMERDRAVLAAGRVMTYEDVVTTADRVQRTFLSTKGPLFDTNGHIIRLFGISRDITELRRAQEVLERRVAERTAELREREAQLAYLIGHFPGVISRVDRDLRYRYASPRYEQWFGKKPEDVIGLTIPDVIGHEAFGKAKPAIEQALAGECAIFEIDVLTVSGQKEHMLVTLEPEFDADGSSAGFAVFVIDITERKRAEAALRESEQRFHLVASATQTGIWDWDLRMNKMYYSLLWKRSLGYEDHEISNSPLEWRSRVHPDDLPIALEKVEAFLNGSLPQYELEHRLQHRDGTYRWILSHALLVRDEQGAPSRIVGSHVDITERKRVEAALRASEQFTREILDSLSAFVAVVDREGTIVAVNRVWAQAAVEHDPWGSSKVSVGANYLEVCRYAADRDSEVKRTLDGIVDVLSGQRTIFETEYLCKRPSLSRWFVMRVTPMSENDGGAVITHEDITERKQAEAALRESYCRLQTLGREVQMARERERRHLSRELHDEFGQLLSALKFDLNRMAGGPARRRQSALLSRQLARASRTVDRLFASLRQLISGLRPALLEEFGLVPALEALVNENKERVGLHGQVIVEGDFPSRLLGPEIEGALYRIAQELLTNVVRHAKATQVTVVLRHESGRVVLAVRDDGRGVPKQARGRIDRYGLLGVHERAELLGGKVEILSDERRGTSVAVAIPVEAGAGRRSARRTIPKRRRVENGTAL